MAAQERPWPWRMIVRGGFRDGWMLAPQEEKNDVFHAWVAVHERWKEMGCRLLATLDDELNMVGQPAARLWNFYSVWEIPEPSIVYDLLNLFRVEDPDTIRLDKYFSIETVVGKPVVTLERRLGWPEQATQSGGGQ
jgi:hypothetical protein